MLVQSVRWWVGSVHGDDGRVHSVLRERPKTSHNARNARNELLAVVCFVCFV